MANAWWVDAWVDGINVVKSAIRNGLRDFGLSYYADAATVATYNLAGAKAVCIGGAVYALDPTDTTTAHSPPAVVVSLDGGRYKPKTSATGLLSYANAAAVAAANTAGATAIVVGKALYALDATDTTTAHSPPAVIVSSNGGRYKAAAGLLYFADAAAVAAAGLAGATAIVVGGVVYALDAADTTSAHSPPTVIVSLDGGRYKPAASSGSSGREVLTAARTYYVRTDGNNANTGLVNSAGGAFLTIQKAVDTVSALDINGQTVTIQIVSGTYNEAVTLRNAVGFAAAGNLVIQGTIGTPGNVTVNCSSGSAFGATNLNVLWYIRDLTLTGTSGIGLNAVGSKLWFNNITFAAFTTGYHMNATGAGALIDNAGTSYTISGGASRHAYAPRASVIRSSGGTLTITGTPTFSVFAHADFNSLVLLYSQTISGSAIGQRYSANYGGRIYTGGGVNYLPGNAAGSISADGAYY